MAKTKSKLSKAAIKFRLLLSAVTPKSLRMKIVAVSEGFRVVLGVTGGSFWGEKKLLWNAFCFILSQTGEAAETRPGTGAPEDSWSR
jgi:hypothetical protein